MVVFLTIFLFKRGPEKEIIDLLKSHVLLSIKGIKLLNKYIDNKSSEILEEIIKIENKGDEIKKKAILNLYKAFLPNMRREVNYSIELLDEVLDNIKHGALIYELITFELDNVVKEKCKLILNISLNILNSLYNLICVLEEGGDFKSYINNIKLGEEEIDNIYHEICKYLINVKINSFWEGKYLCDFIEKITEISDYIEDGADELKIIYLNYGDEDN